MVKIKIPMIEKEKRIPLFIIGLFSLMCIFPIVNSISYDSDSVAPASPQTYPVNIEFNVTWNTSDYIISTSYIEHNNTGTLANYTMTPIINNSGLVGYWKINNDWNNTHVIDASGNDNIGQFQGYTTYDGTLNGDGNEWTTGKYGYGIDFDGADDEVDLGNATEITQEQTELTVSAWVKWSGDTTSHQTIVSDGRMLGGECGFNFDIKNTGYLRFFIDDCTTWGGIIQKDFTGYANTWTYVTAVYNGTHNILYVNGNEFESGTSLNKIGQAKYNLRIGDIGNNAGYDFNGTMDEVRIWNRALTQSEIQDEMNSSHPSTGTGLVGSWSMEENTGTTVHDTNMMVLGKYDAGERFDGADDEVDLGNATEITQEQTELTVSAWVKWSGDLSESQTIVSDGRISEGYGGFFFDIRNTGCLRFFIDNGTTWDGLCSQDFSSFANTWTHVMGIFNGTHEITCINGNCASDTSTISKIGTATYNLRIGREGYFGRYYFNGTIDDVRIYNRALSDTEIENLYELTNPDQETFTYDLDAWATTFSYKFIGIDANSESAISSSDSYTVNKAEANLVLTSSNGWELSEGQSTTLQCTANENATIKLYADDSLVTPPYIFEPELGTHDIICDIGSNFTVSNTSETLTVNPLIACTDTSTFAFQKNITTATDITTLNFTSIVANEYVKTDLSDVDIDNVSDVWINTTDGYYVVVNNTGLSDFTVNFGNYIVNNDYNETATENIIEIDDYTQINAYTKIHSLDEVTGESMYPTNSTLMAIIHCDRGEDYITIEDGDTDILVATKEYIDRASLRVKYSADVYYSRQLYQEEVDRGNLNFYVVDAYEYAVDRIDFHMIDVDYYDSKLQVYKTIQSTPIIITEGYFDASHYFSGYLMEDSEYYLRTYDSDSTYTEFGTLYVTVPAEKELGQTEMDMTSDALLISDNILMNAWMSDNRTQLNIRYEDATNQTQQLNITTYFGNGTQFQFASYDNTSSVNLAYNTTNYTSESFYVDFSILHETFGNSPVTYSVSVFASSVFDLGIGAMWLQLISMGAIVLIGGIATRKTLVAGVVLSLTMLLFFWGIGWLVIETVFIVFMVFLGILAIIIYLKQGGE